MKFIMRIDVDKPYGNHNLPRKLLSKAIEETDFLLRLPAYLDLVMWGAEILRKEKIQAIFYFRNCTKPSPDHENRLREMGHEIGFHCEDTTSEEAFVQELERFRQNLGPIHSVTKHGSGTLKLGRNHYPKYEPDKYHDWSKSSQIPFLFGNGIMDTEGNSDHKPYFSNVFWIERSYRSKGVNAVSDLSKLNDDTVPVLTHFENLKRDSVDFREFETLINFVKNNGFQWIEPKGYSSVAH